MAFNKLSACIVKNPPAEQVALGGYPYKGINVLNMVIELVLIYLQSALIDLQEEIPINICTVSNNKQKELIAK